MSDPLFDGDDEANTPLTEEEREQLISTYISVRAELNEAEQVNITQAMRSLARARSVEVLDDAFLRELHKRMFSDVWKWAGRFRLPAQYRDRGLSDRAPQNKHRVIIKSEIAA